jgi:hypothetical protein
VPSLILSHCHITTRRVSDGLCIMDHRSSDAEQLSDHDGHHRRDGATSIPLTKMRTPFVRPDLYVRAITAGKLRFYHSLCKTAWATFLPEDNGVPAEVKLIHFLHL